MHSSCYLPNVVLDAHLLIIFQTKWLLAERRTKAHARTHGLEWGAAVYESFFFFYVKFTTSQSDNSLFVYIECAQMMRMGTDH